MKGLFYILLLPGLMFAQEQKNHFNMIFGFGPSYFFNDPSLKRYIDHAEIFGFNYQIHLKGNALIFNPGIQFQVNRYHAKLAPKQLAHVEQYTAGIVLDVLMRLRKKMQLRVGMIFGAVPYNVVEVSYRDNNSRGYFSNDDLYKTYSPQKFQASANVGICFLFKLFRREQKFNIKVVQYGSRLVNSDFWMRKDQIGQDAKVLSSKAKPTMLILALEINLQKLKKQKVKELEE